MASNTHEPKHLQPLNTNWHNQSLSNVSATSEAATFHSAHDQPSNMELHPLSEPSTASTTTPQPSSPSPPPSSPKLSAIKMSRQDSGYSETPASASASSTPRTSTSSTRRPSQRRTSKSSTRPTAKRASRSSPSITQLRTSTSSRPSPARSTTTPFSQPTNSVQQPYKFFHFPTLAPAPDPEPTSPQPQHPPPATVQYWTSDSTRRLEYAAIDAASKGVRGFFIKLVPDCILPTKARRTKFHDGEREDAGSVRRYRLVLPEEKDGVSSSEAECDDSNTRQRRGGLLRRWTFGRR